jgi:hypothetical protein
LFGHAVTSKLIISYHATVIGSMERLLHCLAIGLQWSSGERHENLPADGADRYPFGRNTLHFSARIGVEKASAIAGLRKA